MNRWWIYQKERFPLLAHGPLIFAFSACAVAFSSLLRGAPRSGLADDPHRVRRVPADVPAAPDRG